MHQANLAGQGFFLYCGEMTFFNKPVRRNRQRRGQGPAISERKKSGRAKGSQRSAKRANHRLAPTYTSGHFLYPRRCCGCGNPPPGGGWGCLGGDYAACSRGRFRRVHRLGGRSRHRGEEVWFPDGGVSVPGFEFREVGAGRRASPCPGRARGQRGVSSSGIGVSSSGFRVSREGEFARAAGGGALSRPGVRFWTRFFALEICF